MIGAEHCFKRGPKFVLCSRGFKSSLDKVSKLPTSFSPGYIWSFTGSLPPPLKGKKSLKGAISTHLLSTVVVHSSMFFFRFMTDDFTSDIYTKEGLEWIQNANMSNVLIRAFPEIKGLEEMLQNVENAFFPWPVWRPRILRNLSSMYLWEYSLSLKSNMPLNIIWWLAILIIIIYTDNNLSKGAIKTYLLIVSCLFYKTTYNDIVKVI